jgi:6-phosphofructokinase 1
MEGIEEVDRSGDVLAALQQEQINGVISIVGRRVMGVAWKLAKKRVKTVCVPESVENDTAATAVSFGFNTALLFTIELLERKVAMVEVLGQHAGWLALQAGMAVFCRRHPDSRDPI